MDKRNCASLYSTCWEIDVGNATEGVTHLCPTKVVQPAYRQSARSVLEPRFAPEVENRQTILNVTVAYVRLRIR